MTEFSSASFLTFRVVYFQVALLCSLYMIHTFTVNEVCRDLARFFRHDEDIRSTFLLQFSAAFDFSGSEIFNILITFCRRNW